MVSGFQLFDIKKRSKLKKKKSKSKTKAGTSSQMGQ